MPEKWERHEEKLDEDPALTEELDRAETLREQHDEHGEGPLVSPEALKRAGSFLKSQSIRAYKMYNEFTPVPNIGPGGDKSVDLHWRRAGWELLVNIPADPRRLAAFYGDNYGTQKIRGTFDPVTFEWGIINWLMRR